MEYEKVNLSFGQSPKPPCLMPCGPNIKMSGDILHLLLCGCGALSPLSLPPPPPAQRRQTCCKLTLMIPNSDPMSSSSVLLLKMRPELPDPFVLLLTLLPNLLQSRCQGTRHCPDCRLTSCLSSQGFSSLTSSAGEANFPT